MQQILQFIQNFDEASLLWIQSFLRFDFLTPILRFLSQLFDHGMLSIILCILFLFFKKSRYLGFTATTSLILGTVITNLTLKNLVGRARPYQVLDTLETLTHLPADSSFPSGHTCAAFAVAGVLFFCCARKIGIPALIFATLIGWSRLYLGIHFPTDVFVGTFIGLITSFISCLLWHTYGYYRKSSRWSEYSRYNY